MRLFGKSSYYSAALNLVVSGIMSAILLLLAWPFRHAVGDYLNYVEWYQNDIGFEHVEIGWIFLKNLVRINADLFFIIILFVSYTLMLNTQYRVVEKLEFFTLLLICPFFGLNSFITIRQNIMALILCWLYINRKSLPYFLLLPMFHVSGVFYALVELYRRINPIILSISICFIYLVFRGGIDLSQYYVKILFYFQSSSPSSVNRLIYFSGVLVIGYIIEKNWRKSIFYWLSIISVMLSIVNPQIQRVFWVFIPVLFIIMDRPNRKFFIISFLPQTLIFISKYS